ncbi:MAG: cysteine desulfurase family protein [Waddliaceae bacterium]
MKDRIYLDYDAATPTDPRVIRAIESNLKELMANPSSTHSFGRESRQCLIKARDTIAEYLKVYPEEIIFTSGATEGVNVVLRGLFQPTFAGHIVTSGVEHPSVYNTLKDMEKLGCIVTYLKPGKWGAIKPQQVEKALQPNTKLIAVMAVNNETGVKLDIGGIAKIASNEGIPFFSDAVALLGKELFQVPEGVSAMCFSGPKIYATKGVGFCFIRRGLKLSPLITGGSQEYGRRAGTENLPGIVGLAEAVKVLKEELKPSKSKIQELRDRFENKLLETLPDVSINGEGPRVGSTSNVCFEDVDGEMLLTALDMEGVAASHGAACDSGALEPSRVLINMGIPVEKARSSIRFSFGRFTTEAEIDVSVDIIVRAVNRLKL